MTPISHWFVQRRRRIGRVLLLGLAVVWSTMAAAPCVAAMSSCQPTPANPAPCSHTKTGASAQLPDCTPLMQLDCQTAQYPTLTTSVASTDHLLSMPVVVISTLLIAASQTDAHTDSALQHIAAAAAVPRPPLNLLHVRLLL